jgi:hypothetical protein
MVTSGRTKNHVTLMAQRAEFNIWKAGRPPCGTMPTNRAAGPGNPIDYLEGYLSLSERPK